MLNPEHKKFLNSVKNNLIKVLPFVGTAILFYLIGTTVQEQVNTFNNYYFPKEQSSNQVLDQVERQSASPTPIPPTLVEGENIPKENYWQNYQSTCDSFKNSSISYPTNWLLSTEGEQNLSDGYEIPDSSTPETQKTAEFLKKSAASECLLLFGFPFAPGFRQDSYVEGQIAEIWLYSYLAGYFENGQYLPITSVAELEQYELEHNEIQVSRTEKKFQYTSIHKTTINNHEWVVLINEHGETTWKTLNGDKVVIVTFTTFQKGPFSMEHQFDAKTQGYVYKTTEDLVKRLSF